MLGLTANVKSGLALDTEVCYLACEILTLSLLAHEAVVKVGACEPLCPYYASDLPTLHRLK